MTRKKHIEPKDSTATEPAALFFTIPELAKRWRCHRHTIHTAIREGRLQAFRVGERVYRVRVAEVLRYEQAHMQAAVAS